MAKKKDTLIEEAEKIKADLTKLKKKKQVLDSTYTKKAESKPVKKAVKKTTKKAESKPIKKVAEKPVKVKKLKLTLLN